MPAGKDFFDAFNSTQPDANGNRNKKASSKGEPARGGANPRHSGVSWDFVGCDVVAWFRAHECYIGPCPSGETDKHNVRCPFEGEHGEGREERRDTFIRDGHGTIPALLHCSHRHSRCQGGHSDKHWLRDVQTLWGDAEKFGAKPFTGSPETYCQHCGLFGSDAELLSHICDATSEATQEDNDKRQSTAGDAGGGSSRTGGHDRWSEPIPLYGRELPAFPLSAIPAWLRDMVEATAESLQVPVDAPAMIAFPVMSTAVQGALDIHLDDGWEVELSTWAMVCMKSGERKSPTLNAMIEVVREHQKALICEHPKKLRLWERADEARKARIIELGAKLEKETNEEKRLLLELESLSLETENPATPYPPQLLANDATPEAVARILSEQHGRIAFIVDEGTCISNLLGRYSNGQPNMEIYLNGHNGGELQRNRSSEKKPIYMPRTAITFGLTVQPKVLEDMRKADGAISKGLLARFLFSIPTSKVGQRKSRTAATPAKVREVYADAMKHLLSVPTDCDAHDCLIRQHMRCHPEASEVLHAFHDRLEPTRGKGGSNESLTEWLSKLEGQTGRLGALLHLAEHVGRRDPWAIPVSPDTMNRAVTIANYLIPHARVAHHGERVHKATDNAERIRRWIINDGKASFTRTEVREKAKTDKLSTKDQFDEALALLTECGYVRRLTVEEVATRSARGEVYDVNPRLLQ
jgi:replicative DNA helicase